MAESVGGEARESAPIQSRGGRLLRLRSDEQLVDMVRSGNSAAFEVLVSRYRARLLAFCRQMVGSADDAEDLLQEVFAAAYASMTADSREINLRPWLYRVARNRALNHLRAQKTAENATGELERTAGRDGIYAGESAADEVGRRDDLQRLVADVQQLPETQRSALLMREIDGLSFADVAEALDTTVPAVKSLLVRARASLVEAAEVRSARHTTRHSVHFEATDRPASVERREQPGSPSANVETEPRDISKLLFGNRLRMEVAATVATEPSGQIYARALAERLAINDNQAASELKALEAAGLVRRARSQEARKPVLFERLPSVYWKLMVEFYAEIDQRAPLSASA